MKLLNELELIFNRTVVLPKNICSHGGNKFKNCYTVNYLKNHKIKSVYAQTKPKAACVERLQLSFQLLIYTFLVEKSTYWYIDVLQQLMRNYNKTKHSFLDKPTPAAAENPKTWDKVAASHSKHLSRIQKKYTLFQNWGHCKGIIKKAAFRRAYNISHSHQRYIVHKIDQKQIVPFYILKNERGEELSGKFHGYQLVKINLKLYRSYPIQKN